MVNNFLWALNIWEILWKRPEKRITDPFKESDFSLWILILIMSFKALWFFSSTGVSFSLILLKMIVSKISLFLWTSVGVIHLKDPSQDWWKFLPFLIIFRQSFKEIDKSFSYVDFFVSEENLRNFERVIFLFQRVSFINWLHFQMENRHSCIENIS